jgi:putative Mg2+ transporter-C (MgtC) family protein
MSATLSWADVLIRLALGFSAGFLVGLDRGEHAHPAGLRTTILVSVAATVAMIQANWLVAHSTDTHISILRLDMMRLPLGILSGIGFIGAGAILRRGELVRGLTTAATLWLVTVIGLCFGGGQTLLGIAATVVALATLWLMSYVEAFMVPGRRGRISITLSAESLEENAVFALLAERGFSMRSRRIELLPDATTHLTCSGRYRGPYPGWSADLVRDLATRRGISRVQWEDTD